MFQLEGKKKKKTTFQLLIPFLGFARIFKIIFLTSSFHWRAFSPPFARRLMKSKTGGLPETLLVFQLQEQLVPKVFSYLIICKCSVLEQFALSPARETIDGMQ